MCAYVYCWHSVWWHAQCCAQVTHTVGVPTADLAVGITPLVNPPPPMPTLDHSTVAVVPTPGAEPTGRAVATAVAAHSFTSFSKHTTVLVTMAKPHTLSQTGLSDERAFVLFGAIAKFENNLIR
jgi:hypothetical protein